MNKSDRNYKQMLCVIKTIFKAEDIELNKKIEYAAIREKELIREKAYLESSILEAKRDMEFMERKIKVIREDNKRLMERDG